MIHIPEIWVPSHKYVEGGVSIDFKPSASWFVEILDTDGTLRPAKGFEDGKFKNNLILNGYRDYLCSQWDGVYMTSALGQLYTSGQYGQMFFRIGTSSAAPAATQTNLQAYTKEATSMYPSGNGVTVNSSGALTATIKQQFAAETGSATYNECGHVFPPYRLANRLIFPSPVSVTIGQVIVLTLAFTYQTLYNNPQTVTLASDNGINVSGQLGLIGSLNKLFGATVSVGGLSTNTNTYWLIPRNDNAADAGSLTANKYALTGHNSFQTAGLDGSGLYSGTTNSIVALPANYNSNNAYIVGAFHRIYTGTWIPGNPATNIAYNSLTFTDNTGLGGYQLLFNSQQTFTSAATVMFSLDFSY